MHEAMHGAQAYQRALCIVGRVHNERSARQQAKLGLVFKDCGQVRRARVDVSGGRRRCVRRKRRAAKTRVHGGTNKTSSSASGASSLISVQ